MSRKLGIRELKKQLSNYDKDELIKLISDLYKNNQSAQQQISMIIDPATTSDVAATYKKRKDAGIWGHYIDLHSAKSAVSEFKKICHDDFAVIDMMLYYVNSCVQLSLNVGDIDAPFYNSLVSMFGNAVKLINKQNDRAKFEDIKPVIENIIAATSRFGWGVYENLTDLYYEIDFIAECDDDFELCPPTK